MTSLPIDAQQKPKVLIVGAGIGGVCLALLLEKAGVPYLVLERADEIKFLGSAIALGVNAMPFFKQVGLYEDFKKVAKENHKIDEFNENRELEFTMDFSATFEIGGDRGYIISRPVLHELLLRGVPKEKILMKKRVLTMMQGDIGVSVTCADQTVYEGDMLVGADGAYSAVRQALYERMKKNKKLPASDNVPLPFTTTCLVGRTEPLSPTEFPELLEPMSRFRSVKGDNKPYSWMTLTTADNRICWVVIEYLNEQSSKENDSFRQSEWGQEAAESMCKLVRDFPIPVGPEGSNMTLGTLLDRTPKDLISKVMLEEKVFTTWYHGRTILLGDACHKVHIASGAGALNAMQDAIVLANWIAALPSLAIEDMEQIFKEYKKERFDVAMSAYNNGRMLSKVPGAGLTSKIIRYMTRNVPDFLWLIMLKNMAASRPQVWFLPLAKDTGTIPPRDQPSLRKNLHKAASLDTQGQAVSA
ncbi:hypothetical protein EMPS_03816 [Entomortierella parvispora]|uniref:FAD-binding domain-containing protein n=1 Tax=Entomortierella parvispora TaxID=205924 RepID=A0A9P3H7C6_9FUNG|nr:hypothetical protein EMPS_03816 [Entomortierella parvispora]